MAKINPAEDSSPRAFWGRKFMHNASRKYVYLAAWVENVSSFKDSSVTLVDLNGMVVAKSMRWEMFWISYVPSLDKESIFEKNS